MISVNSHSKSVKIGSIILSTFTEETGAQRITC